MLIWWIKTFTLLDYPWKLSCIIFTVWCNLRCPFCHNPEFVLPNKISTILGEIIPEEIFFNFLKTRIWKIDGVVICWGEPTIHSDLKWFILKIKNLWFLVKLDTNWFNFLIVKDLIDNNLIDYIAVDIKHSMKLYPSIVWWNTSDIDWLLNTIDFIKNSNIDYEFRTTLIKWFHNDIILKDILWLLSWSKRYCIQNYRTWNTLNKYFSWKSFSDNELNRFKDIAKEYISEVIVRN